MISVNSGKMSLVGYEWRGYHTLSGPITGFATRDSIKPLKTSPKDSGPSEMEVGWVK
jgi:hypothetical protein